MNTLNETVELLREIALTENAYERETLLRKLSDLKLVFDESDSSKKWVSLEGRIEYILNELGVPCHILGYDYIITGVCELFGFPVSQGRVTKQLYPAIAKKHGTTAARAERAMRHAIELCVDRGDPEVLARYFGNTIDPNKGKPTNSEFLFQLYRIVRREGENYEMDKLC